MKAALHHKWQYGFVRMKLVSFFTQKIYFAIQQQLSNFELMIITQSVENQFLCDSGKQLWSHRLLSASQDVSFHRGKRRMLQIQQIRAADICREHNVKAEQIKRLA